MRRMAFLSLLLAIAPTTVHAARWSGERPPRRGISTIHRAKESTQPAESAPTNTRQEKRKTRTSSGHTIRVEEVEGSLVFAVRVTVEDSKTHKQVSFFTHSADKPVALTPETYQVYTESSRKGFPQETIYRIVDAVTGQVKEEFERSHVPVNNIILEKGDALSITVLPSTRPYNASFFTLGTANTPAAILFTRPYPNQDFLPGEFRGREQFSSAQIAIPFWGNRRAKILATEARRIHKKGVTISPRGVPIRDPELVLGVRTVADDLARTFVEKRSEGGEDFRGVFHTSLLLRRNADGSLPKELLEMPASTLAKELEKQLLWMMQHNVHRANEGGGYAGKTFLDVFNEGKEKALQWPLVSFNATTELQRQWNLLEDEATQRGLDDTTLLYPTLSREVRGSVKWALEDLTERFTSDPLRVKGAGPTDTERIRRNMQETMDAWATDLGLTTDEESGNTPNASALFPAHNRSIRTVLENTLHSVIAAAHRERLNYIAYDPQDLQDVRSVLPSDIPDRMNDLEAIIKRAMQRLELIAPKSAEPYTHLQDDVDRVRQLVTTTKK